MNILKKIIYYKKKKLFLIKGIARYFQTLKKNLFLSQD